MLHKWKRESLHETKVFLIKPKNENGKKLKMPLEKMLEDLKEDFK